MDSSPPSRATRVVHYYARYLAGPSGVTSSLDSWATHAAEPGDEVEVVCAPTGSTPSSYDGAGGPRVRTVRHLGRSRNTWVPVGLGRLLGPGDLLVLHEGWVLSNAVAARAARRRGARVVVVPHGVYEAEVVAHQRDPGGLRARLDRWVLRRADAVHVFYPGERDVVRRFEPRAGPFLTVPNGAPDVPPAARWTGRGDYFLWMGRFDVHHKGLDHLLGFWARLPEPRPRLVMAGPDFLGGRERVASQVRQLGLDEVVTLQESVSGTAKDELLAGCRAYLHPSRWESCSIMLLEALAAGVPCLISSTIHAAAELGPSGILHHVRFDSPEVDGGAALAGVDRNAVMGADAREWVGRSGSWRAVGRDLVDEQERLGLRAVGT